MTNKMVCARSFAVLSIACVVCVLLACEQDNVVTESEERDSLQIRSDIKKPKKCKEPKPCKPGKKCKQPKPCCGDGNVDPGEECDGTPNCADDCTLEPGTCTSNEMCDPHEFCQKALGNCDGEGTCIVVADLNCAEVWEPVCGCDGETYSNDCYALLNSINIDYEGACKPVTTACKENANCLSDSIAPNVYCAKEEGDCDGEGECMPRPEICITLWDPVCGCDGVKYGNDCEAAVAGVNVDYQGECKIEP